MAQASEVAVLDHEMAARILSGEVTEAPAVKVEDPLEVSLRIVGEILSSEDIDGVFGGTTAVGGSDILDRPFELRGVRWLKSSFTGEGGLPIFAILDAHMMDTGEVLPVTTGAANIMAQVLRLVQLDALPIDVRIVESENQTASGYRPQRLLRAGSSDES